MSILNILNTALNEQQGELANEQRDKINESLDEFGIYVCRRERVLGLNIADGTLTFDTIDEFQNTCKYAIPVSVAFADDTREAIRHHKACDDVMSKVSGLEWSVKSLVAVRAQMTPEQKLAFATVLAKMIAEVTG